MVEDPGVVVVNLRLLEQAGELIARIPDDAYAAASPPARPVGPHFRHILEHYSGFLSGLPERRIDYDARPRERRIETEREAARERVRELMGGLTPIAATPLDVEVEIRFETGLGGEDDQWSRSTGRRELQFLLSHTIHHFALIGLLLHQQGIDPGPDFGVAPSTLRHWREQAPCAPRPG